MGPLFLVPLPAQSNPVHDCHPARGKENPRNIPGIVAWLTEEYRDSVQRGAEHDGARTNTHVMILRSDEPKERTLIATVSLIEGKNRKNR